MTSVEDWLLELSNIDVSRADMNKIIMDYLIKEGFIEAAETFSREAGLASEAEQGIDARIKAKTLIQEGNIKEAMVVVREINAKIFSDHYRPLLFLMQQQHLIELIREGEVEVALEFAQAELAAYGAENTEARQQLERTMALLAFDRPQDSPFADLMDVRHRHKVAAAVNEAILEWRSLPPSPHLKHVVKLLLWTQQAAGTAGLTFPRLKSDLTGFSGPQDAAEDMCTE